MGIFKSKSMIGLMVASIGLFAQTAQAASDYSNAVAYAKSFSGIVMGRLKCGGVNAGAPNPCDEAWQQVDDDSNIRFIQAAGHALIEVESDGRIYIQENILGPGPASGWIYAGTDTGVTSQTQITAGRSNQNLAGANNIYKASGGKLFQWVAGTSWQELTAFSAKGVVAVSGDFVTTNTPGTGLRSVFHISSGTPGAPVIDREYGPIVGTLDSFSGGSSSAYLARFIPGTTSNQETVNTTSVYVLPNTQYGPLSFTFTDIKGLAVGARETVNDIFMLFPRSTTAGDNNVLMVHEGSTTGTTNPGTVVRAGLSSQIAAATSYAPFGGGMRSFLWVLVPGSAGVVEYQCSATSAACTVALNAPVLPNDGYVQLVATTDWVAGDPD